MRIHSVMLLSMVAALALGASGAKDEAKEEGEAPNEESKVTVDLPKECLGVEGCQLNAKGGSPPEISL